MTLNPHLRWVPVSCPRPVAAAKCSATVPSALDNSASRRPHARGDAKGKYRPSNPACYSTAASRKAPGCSWQHLPEGCLSHGPEGGEATIAGADAAPPGASGTHSWPGYLPQARAVALGAAHGRSSPGGAMRTARAACCGPGGETGARSEPSCLEEPAGTSLSRLPKICGSSQD